MYLTKLRYNGGRKDAEGKVIAGNTNRCCCRRPAQKASGSARARVTAKAAQRAHTHLRARSHTRMHARLEQVHRAHVQPPEAQHVRMRARALTNSWCGDARQA